MQFRRCVSFAAVSAMEVPILLRDSSSSEVRRTVKLELDEKEATDTASREKVFYTPVIT